PLLWLRSTFASRRPALAPAAREARPPPDWPRLARSRRLAVAGARGAAPRLGRRHIDLVSGRVDDDPVVPPGRLGRDPAVEQVFEHGPRVRPERTALPAAARGVDLQRVARIEMRQDLRRQRLPAAVPPDQVGPAPRRRVAAFEAPGGEVVPIP